MPRYPERIIQPNGWQIAGQAAQDVGQQLGGFADKQQRLRASFDTMMERRKAKALAEMEAADKRRREEEDLQLRKDEADRKAKAPVEWKPANQEEAIEFERKKAAAINESKPTPKPSDGEIGRQQRRTKALKSIPIIWSEIQSHQEQIPQRIDPMDEGWKAWERRARELKSKLNQEELEAGINPSAAIAGNLNDNPSYRLFRGMRGDAEEPPATAPAPTPTPRPARGPLDEAAAAEDWLARNPNSPIAAKVRAKLDSLRAAGGPRGL